MYSSGMDTEEGEGSGREPHIVFLFLFELLFPLNPTSCSRLSSRLINCILFSSTGFGSVLGFYGETYATPNSFMLIPRDSASLDDELLPLAEFIGSRTILTSIFSILTLTFGLGEDSSLSGISGSSMSPSCFG